MEFSIRELPNGIKCILKRIKSPVAYCALTINAGSRDETEEEFGAAHFTEHMLFKGTDRRRAHHINSRLERLGGELNAFTTKEETVIHATTLAVDIEKACELISDIAFCSRFPAEEMEKEREVIIDEINSYKDSPTERIYDEFEDMIFRGCPLGHNILGSESSVAAMRREGIQSFVRRCYNTDNMVFSIAADIDERSFRRLTDRWFGIFDANVRSFTRTSPPGAEKFTCYTDRKTHQTHCIIGSRAYDYHNPSRMALALLVNHLGGPAANSLLNNELREKRGLTYNVEASYTPYSDTGLTTIYFGTEADNTDRCIALIGKELSRLSRNRLSGATLDRIKKQYTGQLSIAMESNEGYILGAAKSLMIYGEVDSPEDIFRKVSSVTPGQVNEAAAEVFGDMSTLIYN